MNKKNIGYRLFGLCFTVFRIFRVRPRKVFLIATHDDGPEGNIAVTMRVMKKMDPRLTFVTLTKKDRGSNPFSFFFVKAFHMATAGIILLDNVFMPMAYTPISAKTTVIQLWHGTGTIKKFGLDSDGEEVAALARRGNKRLSWLVVNGERTRRQYATAFGLPPEKIRMTGLPRTDLLLNADYINKKKNAFFSSIRGRIENPKEHRFVLYAPTFRDQEADRPKLMLDPETVLRGLPEDVILLLRFHPHVAEHFAADKALAEIPEDLRSRVINVSDYPGVTTLLAAADVLVTDYSSIVFEYALLKRPMVFFAYDLEEFERTGRDFYEPYESFVPGPVTKDSKELILALNKSLDEGADEEMIGTFLRENYRRMDGHAAKRVALLAFRGKKF